VDVGKKQVAIAIVTHTNIPSEKERISFFQCLKILGDHPIFIVCPDGLEMTFYQKFESDSLVIRPVHPKHLASKRSYNRFKVSRKFYQLFEEFEFVLTYELDSYVFKDSLLEWCDLGFDYVGAPWFEGYASPAPPYRFLGVGNSGFSLRNVSACLKVLRGFSFIEGPAKSLEKIVAHLEEQNFDSPNATEIQLLTGNNTNGLVNSCYLGNEDIFWGLVVPQRLSWFKVAPPEIALRFSFEVKPKFLYHMNGRQLPFGCHAWARYDPQFWKRFIT